MTIWIVVCNTAVPHKLCTSVFETEREANCFIAASSHPVRQFVRYQDGSTTELVLYEPYFSAD